MIETNNANVAPASNETFFDNGKLFPDNHGDYVLPLSNNNESLVYTVVIKCPVCGLEFERLGIFSSKLRRKGTDPDSRERYVYIEPLYYEIITCPQCLLSADLRTFSETAASMRDRLAKLVEPLKEFPNIKLGRERDTFSVFAGYYLSLLSAPLLHFNHQVKTGGLWLKLSRLYSDCNDEKMERFAIEKSFEDYQYANNNLRLNDQQTIQVSYVLGELNFKLGNLEAARNAFFEVKSNKTVTAVLKRQAENRMEEIRDILMKDAPPPEETKGSGKKKAKHKR